MFRLSTQVAAQSSWLTDGPSRRVVLGKRIVDLRHASPKHLISPRCAAGTVVQALRHVGASRAADVVQVAARTLSDGDKKILGGNATQAPARMRATLLSIAGHASGDMRGQSRPPARQACRPLWGERHQRGVANLTIEMDFWVGWTQRRIFALPQGETASLVIKGGTLFSTAYGAIRRFPEDIDLSKARRGTCASPAR